MLRGLIEYFQKGLAPLHDALLVHTGLLLFLKPLQVVASTSLSRTFCSQTVANGPAMSAAARAAPLDKVISSDTSSSTSSDAADFLTGLALA